jgi:hypothetical protein
MAAWKLLKLETLYFVFLSICVKKLFGITGPESPFINPLSDLLKIDCKIICFSSVG